MLFQEGNSEFLFRELIKFMHVVVLIRVHSVGDVKVKSTTNSIFKIQVDPLEWKTLWRVTVIKCASTSSSEIASN